MPRIPLIVLGLLISTLPALATAGSITVTQPANPDCASGPGSFAHFGLPLTSAGKKVLVGADGSGCGFVFDGRTGGLLLTLESPASDSSFGQKLATEGDGFLIGAPGVGATYLFDGRTGALRQTYTDPGQFDFAPAAVAGLDGRVAMSGQKFDPVSLTTDFTVDVFATASAALVLRISRTAAIGGQEFGHSLAALGDELVVGAPSNDLAGNVFVLDPRTGTVRLTLTAPHPLPDDLFGEAVATFGGNVLVGAPGPSGQPGSAYLFDGGNGHLLQTFSNPAAPDDRCFACAVAGKGNRVLIGSPSFHSEFDPGPVFGAAYVFDATTGALRKTLVGSHDNGGFGSSVAVFPDGLAIGEPEVDFGDTGEVLLVHPRRRP